MSEVHDTKCMMYGFGKNCTFVIFRWAIPVVFDMIRVSRQRSQTQLVHILFARCSLKLTACFGLSSVRSSSGHKSFIEETIQYILVYKSQQDANVTEFIFVRELLYVFRVSLSPIFRSTKQP